MHLPSDLANDVFSPPENGDVAHFCTPVGSLFLVANRDGLRNLVLRDINGAQHRFGARGNYASSKDCQDNLLAVSGDDVVVRFTLMQQALQAALLIADMTDLTEAHQALLRQAYHCITFEREVALAKQEQTQNLCWMYRDAGVRTTLKIKGNKAGEFSGMEVIERDIFEDHPPVHIFSAQGQYLYTMQHEPESQKNLRLPKGLQADEVSILNRRLQEMVLSSLSIEGKNDIAQAYERAALAALRHEG